jgi:hypothetical protein
MNLEYIASTRLTSQHLTGSKMKTPSEVVGWMGAMQAQDYGMAKWAVGVRLPGSTDKRIEDAISSGEILRTHLLRPTWHLVTASDIRWMVALTAPHIKTTLRSRHNELGLSTEIINKSNKTFENALKKNRHLTREEMQAELGKAGIDTSENRLSHLLLSAELDGILCSGRVIAGKQTYALLDNRVPVSTSIPDREESLAKLAGIYFSSRCPATLQDFVWWSGLPVGDAKRALDVARPHFAPEPVGAQTFWLPASCMTSGFEGEHIHMLPAFDEFIISYQDRTASIPTGNQKKMVSSNGIFRPVIVHNGRVIGIWKRAVKKDKVIITTELFSHSTAAEKILIRDTASLFGNFLDKNIELSDE